MFIDINLLYIFGAVIIAAVLGTLISNSLNTVQNCEDDEDEMGT